MNKAIEQRLTKAEILCKQMKARLTPVRRDLLTLIYSHNGHLTAYELLRQLKASYPKVEAMTVYRALDFLQKHHLVHRVASQNAFTACETPDHEHHAQLLLCEKCGHAEEMGVKLLEEALQTVAKQNQFTLSGKPVEITGICRNCIV